MIKSEINSYTHSVKVQFDNCKKDFTSDLFLESMKSKKSGIALLGKQISENSGKDQEKDDDNLDNFQGKKKKKGFFGKMVKGIFGSKKK